MRQKNYLIIAGTFLLFHSGCEYESETQTNAAELSNNAIELSTNGIDCTSPIRDPAMDGKVWLDFCRNKLAKIRAASKLAVKSKAVIDNNVPWKLANFDNVPEWSDADIKSHFEATRDDNSLRSSRDSSFKRRISWLYPDDGCYSRAELVVSNIGKIRKDKPYKLFSFGSLVVKSDNYPYYGGYLSWSYHVIPVVKNYKKEIFVFDAAIDPSQPLPLKQWLEKQVPSLDKITITVADSNAYIPTSDVTGSPNSQPKALSIMETEFLNKEWDRQKHPDIDRDPTVVLGDCPPWDSVKKPGPASNPNPIYGATNISTIPTLTWTTGSGATSHDVYLGTVSGMKLVSSQTGTFTTLQDYCPVRHIIRKSLKKTNAEKLLVALGNSPPGHHQVNLPTPIQPMGLPGSALHSN